MLSHYYCHELARHNKEDNETY